MNKKLLKSMLVVACAIMGGQNAWAEETRTLVYSNDFETSSDFTATGKTDGYTLNPGTTNNNFFASQVIGVACGTGDKGLMSPKFDIGEAKLVDVELKFKLDGCSQRKGSGLYFVTNKNTIGYNNQPYVFSIVANSTSNGQWNTITAGGEDVKDKVNITNAGSNFEYTMSGNRNTTGIVVLNLRLNFTTKTAAYSLSRTDGTVLIDNHTVSFQSQSDSFYGLFVHAGQSYGGSFVDDLKVYTVSTTEETKTASYKINYVCDGNVLKSVDSKVGVVGDKPILSSTDTDNFYNEDNTKKYIFETSDVDSKTIAEDGSTVITLTYREAAIYNYTVNATDENNSILYQIATGTVFEGESSRVYYNKAFLSDGKWYMIDGNKSYPTYALDIDKEGTSNVVYSKANIAYFAECENLTKSSNNAIATAGSYPERYSNGKAVRLFKNSYLYTDAFDKTKTYTLYLWGRNNSGSSVANITLGLRDADGNVTDLENAFTDWALGISELKSVTDITIPAGSSLVLRNPNADWNSNLEMDYIYLVEQLPTSIPASISAAKFATFIPSYNIVAQSDVKAYTVKVNAEKTGIELNEIAEGTVIPAGTALLLNAAEGSYDFAVSTDDASTLADNDLVAATADVTATGNEYALTKKNGVVGFAPVQVGVVIPAGKAYLQVDNSNGDAAKFITIGGGDATGISTINAADKAADAYYTLQGVKTMKPAAKGVYILNGKKVIVNK